MMEGVQVRQESVWRAPSCGEGILGLYRVGWLSLLREVKRARVALACRIRHH